MNLFMIKIISLFICMVIGIVAMSAQIRFSANANVYDQTTNQKIGTQYIAANIESNGVGTMTLGKLTLKAIITNTERNNKYNMSAYSVTLHSQNGQTVDVVMTIRDKGTCTVLVYYGDGTLRYDFSIKCNQSHKRMKLNR